MVPEEAFEIPIGIHQEGVEDGGNAKSYLGPFVVFNESANVVFVEGQAAVLHIVDADGAEVGDPEMISVDESGQQVSYEIIAEGDVIIEI